MLNNKNDLILIQNIKCDNEEVKACNARELHEKLEINSKFADWIKNRISKYDFIENKDFITVSKILENGGKTIDYFISIDMAKELCMVENNKKGKEIRRYFIECEKALKKNIQERFLDSYMIEDPTKRALKWIEERQEFNKQIEEKNNIIQEKQETIDTIKVNQGERTYKKQLKTDIVKIVKLINLSAGADYDSVWNEIYNKFIKMHNFTWNLEFFKSKNKLEYVADKSINYLKDLKQIATSMI